MNAVSTSVRPTVAEIPGSKSITARALFAAAAAPGTSTLLRPLVSDDTLAFADGLRALGYSVERGGGDAQWRVTGTGAGPTGTGRVYCRDSGTAARFLPALIAAGTGRYAVDGSDQMRARPMRPLLDALRGQGARVDARDDRLPLEIAATGLAGGEILIDGEVSSQFPSALCLAAPLAREPVTLRVRGLVSRPYLGLTAAVMTAFGATATHSAGTDDVVEVARGYAPTEYAVEPDASSASYAFAAAALTGRSVTVPGLGAGSAQGDLGFVGLLERMGATVRVTDTATTVTGPERLSGLGSVNMRDISDTMMSLAAIAPFADGPTRIEGVGNTRVKESDRIAVVAANLERLGVTVHTGTDWIEIHPAEPGPATVACHRDHRIAMAFAVTGLRVPGLRLDDLECVGKTFPGFHAMLGQLRAAWS